MNQIILNQDNIEKNELTVMRPRAQDIIEQCGRVIVESQEQFGSVGDLVKIGRNELKRMDDARKTTIKAPQDYVRWVNAKFHELMDPLKTAVDAAADKAKKWGREEERRRQEQERKDREEAERVALEQAEADEKAAKEARDKAAAAEKKADEANDPAKAEQARQEAETLKEQASQHDQAANDIIDAAADAPKVDTTVRKVRGDYGTTTGIRKTLTFELHDLDGLPREFREAIITNGKAVDAIRVAIKKDALAMDYFNKYLKEKAEKHLEDMDQVTIAGITIFYDQDLTVR
jgi:flagellar biosynthesis GTPase FlhF